MASRKSHRPWIQLDQSHPLLYRKEAIYRGDFGKLDESGDGLEFAAKRATLRHWAESVAKLRANGIKIPLARNHDEWDDPEKQLGEVVAASVEKNRKGLDALFLNIRFDSEQSRDIALKGDVSIGSPPKWIDGKKREYVYPLQHVASTNAPVIPGLESWQKIAAAFTQPKGSNMELDELIELLGIQVDDETAGSDEAKKALIKAKLAELTSGAPKPTDDPPADDMDMSHDDGTEGAPKPKAGGSEHSGGASGGQVKRVAVHFSHPVVVKTVRDARLAQLDAMVDSNTITPATRTMLAKKHCSEAGIKLELSHDSENGGSAFDDAVELAKAMAKERPLKNHGRTAVAGDYTDEDVIELAHDKSQKGALAKNMEKLAASRGQKQTA